MDDLVRSYFEIYGCNVVQESFESIGEKRYTIVEEFDLDFIIEEIMIEEGYELDENTVEKVKNLVRPHINKYAVKHGIHKAPGWVKGSKRQEAVTKPVIKHFIRSTIEKITPKQPEEVRLKPIGIRSGMSLTANPEKYEQEKAERRKENPNYSTSNVRVRMKESVEKIKEIINKGAKAAGSKEEDLTRGQVKERLEKDKEKIRKALQKEENEIVIQALLDNGYASCYDNAEGIMEAMSEAWKTEILNSDRK